MMKRALVPLACALAIVTFVGNYFLWKSKTNMPVVQNKNLQYNNNYKISSDIRLLMDCPAVPGFGESLFLVYRNVPNENNNQTYTGRGNDRNDPNSSTSSSSPFRVTLVTEFYVPVSEIRANQIITASRRNMKRNAHHGRFIFLISSHPQKSEREIETLKQLASETGVKHLEIYWIPGGVTFQDFFLSTLLYDSIFVVHHSDISVGDLTPLLDGCSNLMSKKMGLVGSRYNAVEIPGEDYNVSDPKSCQLFSSMGSADVFIARSLHLTCEFFYNMRFALPFFGGENVIGSQLLQSAHFDVIADPCPYWNFFHLKFSETENQPHRNTTIRINHGQNSWVAGPPEKNEKRLGEICNLNMLNPDPVIGFN